MSTELLVALIAATAGLGVATVSAIIAHRTSQRLEILRASLASDVRRQSLHEEENRDTIRVLDRLVSESQALRDKILMIRDATDNSLLGKTARILIAESGREIRNVYGGGLPHLLDDEVRVCHDVKRLAFAVESLVAESCSVATAVSMSRDVLIQLDAYRAELAALQSALREARMKRMYGPLSLANPSPPPAR